MTDRMSKTALIASAGRELSASLASLLSKSAMKAAFASCTANAFFVLIALTIPHAANAEQITIVALGASNTQGYGVDIRQAFPTKLEALLKQKGYDVRVLNAGIPGDRTSDMLARLDDWVPKGTKLVLLQEGTNDARYGVSAEKREANVQEIMKRLSARGAKTVLVDRVVGGQAVPKQYLQPDNIHYKVEGHALIANKLLRPVMGALGAPSP